MENLEQKVENPEQKVENPEQKVENLEQKALLKKAKLSWKLKGEPCRFEQNWCNVYIICECDIWFSFCYEISVEFILLLPGIKL